MPDVTGVVTDHDTRLIAKVMGATPTVPPPFTGMFWYDTSSPNPFMTVSVTIISSGPYTVQPTNECVVVTGSNSFTVFLPPATGSGRTLWIKTVDTGTITVDGNGSDTIDDSLTQTLLQYDSLMVCDYVVNKWIAL
jgi:hypothetical protein